MNFFPIASIYTPSPSYIPPIQHVSAPSFTPTIAIVPPSNPRPSYGAPPSPLHSAPALNPSFSIPAPSPSYGAPPSPSFSAVAPSSSSHSSFSAGPAFGSAPSSSFDSFSPVASSAGAEQTIVHRHVSFITEISTNSNHLNEINQPKMKNRSISEYYLHFIKMHCDAKDFYREIPYIKLNIHLRACTILQISLV